MAMIFSSLLGRLLAVLCDDPSFRWGFQDQGMHASTMLQPTALSLISRYNAFLSSSFCTMQICLEWPRTRIRQSLRPLSLDPSLPCSCCLPGGERLLDIEPLRTALSRKCVSFTIKALSRGIRRALRPGTRPARVQTELCLLQSRQPTMRFCTAQFGEKFRRLCTRMCSIPRDLAPCFPCIHSRWSYERTLIVGP